MAIDYTGFAIPKGTPRIVDRIRQKRDLAEKERDCERCGAPLPTGECKWGVRRFCSVLCRNRSIAEKNRRHPKRECPICHRRMEGVRLTCSAACGYRFRKLRSRRPKNCPICSREFWPLRGRSTKYCSKACFNVKASERLAMRSVTCAHCARTFRRTEAAVKRVANVFCNRICRAAFMKGENSPMWRGGHDPNRGPKWNALAERMRRRDGYRCQRCNKSQEENGQRLDVDHIMPWRMFDEAASANAEENLTSLCKSCHCLKTATFEQAFMRGDCLGMYRYEQAIRQQPLRLFEK